MLQIMLAGWLAVILALLASTASAQTTPPTPSAATVPQSDTATSQYRSALENYQPYGESKQVPWKEANDKVGKIGGWRAYAKEAAQGQAPASDGKAGETKK